MQKLKNNEARPKFTCSYKKRVLPERKIAEKKKKKKKKKKKNNNNNNNNNNKSYYLSTTIKIIVTDN